MLRQNFNNQSYWQIFLDWLTKFLREQNEDHAQESEAEGEEPDQEAPTDEETPDTGPDEEEPETRYASAPAASAPPAPGAAAPAAAAPETADHSAFSFVAAPRTQTIPAGSGGTAVQAPHSTAIFWGDSIADGMARSVQRGTFANVVNRATPGAGFLTSIKPQDLGTLPQNSAAFIYFGTNDVASLIGQSDEQIAAYARRVIAVAQEMKAQGADTVVLGLNAPKGAYTGGSAVWRQEGFVDNWTRTMERLNEQYRIQAEAAGIRYAATDAQITASEISSDNLHLTTAGNRELVSIGTQALKA